MKSYKKSDAAIAALTPEQRRVTQQNGTENPGTGEHLDNKEPGIYVDVVSGEPLFVSSDKFESGCGWPSFTRPIEPAHINELRDVSHGMVRTEVRSVHAMTWKQQDTASILIKWRTGNGTGTRGSGGRLLLGHAGSYSQAAGG
jgi:methionine-R-sulfoxide reductase